MGDGSGGVTPAAARQMIEKVSSDSWQFGARSDAIIARGADDAEAAEKGAGGVGQRH